MRYKWEIIRDWHDKNEFFPDEEKVREFFVGTPEELEDHICGMRECGCTNISTYSWGAVDGVEAEEEDPFEEEYEDPWEREYIRSVTGGDYGSANPWDAPGMRGSDFVRGIR